MQECKDKLQSDDGMGRQVLHRNVKIPFTLSYYSSALKMKLEVDNDKRTGQVIPPLLGIDAQVQTDPELMQ